MNNDVLVVFGSHVEVFAISKQINKDHKELFPRRKEANMILKLAVLVCCLAFVLSRPYDDVSMKKINEVFDRLLEDEIKENEERGDNVHGHIVRVNEARDNSRRGFREDNSIEEDIVAVNEDPNNRPRCLLFEGDLCLDREDEAVVNQETDLKRNVIKNTNKLWPHKTVYYSVDQNLKHLRPKIDDAINLFHDKTCLTFREVDTSYGGDHIKMSKGNGCWSKVGRSGGGQTLSLGSGCEYVGVVLHELMHSIGIWHEQSRPDRDNYVEILWQNIQPGKKNNFLKYEHGKLDTLGLAYDYESVMHYDRYLYSVDPGKKPTIIKRGRPWVRLGGQLRGTLTLNDINEIKALYNC